MITALIIKGALFGIVLWVAARITGIQGSLLALVGIAIASALATLIPTIGWIIAIQVVFLGLKKFTTADFWPDAVLIAVIANGIVKIGELVLRSA